MEKQASGSVTVSETSAVSKLVPGGEDGTGVSFGRSVARSQWRSVLLAAHCLLQSCANALGIVKTSKGQKGNMKITSRDEGLEISVASLPRVWVHVSLPVVAIMITLPLWHGFHPQKLIAAAIIVVGVIASIFAHELGHALMARRLGLKPVLIKLHSGGGEAIWEGESWTRTQDRLITIAGPFVNLILGGACLASYALFLPDASSPFQPSVERSWITPPPMADPPLFRALNWLGWINIIRTIVVQRDRGALGTSTSYVLGRTFRHGVGAHCKVRVFLRHSDGDGHLVTSPFRTKLESTTPLSVAKIEDQSFANQWTRHRDPPQRKQP